jgi:hypothetical protein
MRVPFERFGRSPRSSPAACSDPGQRDLKPVDRLAPLAETAVPKASTGIGRRACRCAGHEEIASPGPVHWPALAFAAVPVACGAVVPVVAAFALVAALAVCGMATASITSKRIASCAVFRTAFAS